MKKYCFLEGGLQKIKRTDCLKRVGEGLEPPKKICINNINSIKKLFKT